MQRPSSLSNIDVAIADASAMINLCACGVVREIIEALPFKLVMVPAAIIEVRTDPRTGRAHDKILADLLFDGLVEERHLSEAAEEIFAGLVIGSAAETLDDGEAASIAFGITHGLAVVIDERKANKLCARRFPELNRISSGDLFLNQEVATRLGSVRLCNAVFDALRLARMRVQDHHLNAIATMLGPERVRQCPSLPTRIRKPATPAS